MHEYTESYPLICIGWTLSPTPHVAVLRTVAGGAFDEHLGNQSSRLVGLVWRVHKGHTVTHVLGGKDYEIEKGKDFIQLITPPVRQVTQLPPSTKKTKPYSKATKEPLKASHRRRSIQDKDCENYQEVWTKEFQQREKEVLIELYIIV